MVTKRIDEIENLEKGNTYLDCIVEFFEDYNYKNIRINNNDEILDLDDNNKVVGKLKDFIIAIGKTRKGMGEINA
ncbi:hypothetical protein [Clostridium perfringens]|uniref:hypothetical protein n=1 Tax=Clostridium perfringens TaxID=1502 RepID=UPI002245BA33|nr:hypothetical protein [Clostridium perfringens]MCX0369053.1 hypothetical protein [Clostridium perfringens]MCX0402168.1 hypothetical protein [Clostridium perfringens]MDK0553518.1 hypothetical protein [Clostridium perfringens]MDT7932606.1 hypothetical protein [Clostridium perfringens]MDT7956683.1 hypothetical protein [Clostridium perfringens]